MRNYKLRDVLLLLQENCQIPSGIITSLWELKNPFRSYRSPWDGTKSLGDLQPPMRIIKFHGNLQASRGEFSSSPFSGWKILHFPMEHFPWLFPDFPWGNAWFPWNFHGDSWISVGSEPLPSGMSRFFVRVFPPKTIGTSLAIFQIYIPNMQGIHYSVLSRDNVFS